jgi:hypothetical protein
MLTILPDVYLMLFLLFTFHSLPVLSRPSILCLLCLHLPCPAYTASFFHACHTQNHALSSLLCLFLSYSNYASIPHPCPAYFASSFHALPTVHISCLLLILLPCSAHYALKFLLCSHIHALPTFSLLPCFDY